MKMRILLLLLLFSNLMFCQTFTFDIGSTQELSGKGKIIASNYKLSNSKNDNYTMIFYGNGFASIFDKRNLTRHEFEVKSSVNQKFEVSYLRSCEQKDFYNKVILINKDDWDFRVSKINDSIFELSEYKRKKAKKPTRRTVVKIKESDKNYISLLHQINDRHLKLLMDKLDKSKNYTIVEMSNYFNEVKGKDMKLIDVIELSDYVVVLPSKLEKNETCVTHYF